MRIRASRCAEGISAGPLALGDLWYAVLVRADRKGRRNWRETYVQFVCACETVSIYSPAHEDVATHLYPYLRLRLVVVEVQSAEEGGREQSTRRALAPPFTHVICSQPLASALSRLTNAAPPPPTCTLRRSTVLVIESARGEERERLSIVLGERAEQ